MVQSQSRSMVLIFALVSLLLILVLLMMHRPLWCKCGEMIPWAWNVWSSHNSQHLIDFYSPSHIIHGIVLFALLRSLDMSRQAQFFIALIIESAWEILENSSIIIERYRSVTASLDYSGDTIGNSFADLGMCAAGFILASKLPARASIGLIVLFETTTTWIIRDGLLLNIIMLVYPVEAIKEWQSAASNAG